jgi:alpha-1,2-mannosyltransferase
MTSGVWPVGEAVEAATQSADQVEAWPLPGVLSARIRRQSAGVVIASLTVLALGLRLFQLSRPNYLFGVTEYDDGVLFGNALRLVNGAIPYRDFAMVQPPGSTVLMAPVALLAKSIGSASGLAAARLLTAAADTACVVVLGLLVRHRGALATGLACGIYAVYPAALNASQTFMLEPWLNLFCLLGLLALFDRDRLASRSRLAWAGACFGFAASIKIWALAPALVAAIVCLWCGREHLKALLTYAGGLVAGVVIPCLPFFIAAPRSFTRSVFVAELIQATHGRVSPVPRLADITGLLGLGGLTGRGDIGRGPVVAGAVVAVILLVAIWLLAWRAGRAAGILDWFALATAALVIVMLVWPSEWYLHYAAFAGPFVALIVALPVARIVAVSERPVALLTGATAGIAIVVMAAVSAGSIASVRPAETSVRVDKVIPAGACVVTDSASMTVTADRFVAREPGCAALVDSVGTMIALTNGQDVYARPAMLASVADVWRSAFSRAQYVWLVGRYGNTGNRIAWTSSLHSYFISHFRLISFRSRFRGTGYIPRGGLYVRVGKPTRT